MRTTGTVKWFNDSKGYGLIKAEGADAECYVHHSRIQGPGFHTLTVGERVEFDLAAHQTDVSQQVIVQPQLGSGDLAPAPAGIGLKDEAADQSRQAQTVAPERVGEA